MEVQEHTARKWRRKSRPTKLGRSTSEEEQMEEDPSPEVESESFTTEDKENSQLADNDCQCSICSRIFGSKIQLQTHMRLHANGRGLTCDHCGKQYANKSKLKRHSRSHTGEKPYSCSFCSKNFSRSDNLTTHILRQHQAARVCACAKCYATYITVRELKEHMDCCHPGEGLFQCALCDEVKVESGELLMDHLKAVHDDIILKISVDEPMNVDEPPTNNVPDKPTVLPTTIKSPVVDMDTSSTASVVVKNDNYSNSGSKRKTTTPKKLKPSGLDESGDSVSDYEEVDSPRHGSIRGDSDLSLMKHKIFTRKYEQTAGAGSNNAHPDHSLPKRPRHNNQVFACMKCDVVFDSEDVHNEHNELFHDRSDSPSSYSSKGSIEEEWPNAVACEICHLLLKNIHYLQRHLQRKHHDGIDYLCPRCPERQATLTGLIDHVRVQHSTGEESHCEECNELFPNRVDLQEHFRQHRVHQCNLCSKQFTMIHKLQRHLRRHFGSKNHSCQICGQRYTNEKDMAVHVERVHGVTISAYGQKDRSSDDNSTSQSVRYTVSKASMCMTCGKTLPWGARKLRVSPGEQWASMCKECVDRCRRPKEWLVGARAGDRGPMNGQAAHNGDRECDTPDDESSESGISGDESISGKSVHSCGLCSITCVSVPKLILHMDSDHHGVDKRHLWDVLVETILAHRPLVPGGAEESLYGQTRVEMKAKVLAPLNDNKPRDEDSRLVNVFSSRPTVSLNPPLIIAGHAANWFSTTTADLSNLHRSDQTTSVAAWVQKPNKLTNLSPMTAEIIAMDLTSKKANDVTLKTEKVDSSLREDGIAEAKYRCESCPAAFETQENLDAHTRNHEMNAQARCYICNQDMASQTELLKHLMLHRHTSYHCKVCGKSLSSWSKFEAHMGTHDNGAKFACCFCDIQFFDKTRLTQHLSDVHDRTDSQICGACGKIYFDHKLLEDHIKEHEDDDMTPPPAVLPVVDSKEGSNQRGRPKLRRMIEDRRQHLDNDRPADVFFTSPLAPNTFPSSVNLDSHIDSRARSFAASLITRTISDNVGTSSQTVKSLTAKREESPLDKQSHVCVYCDKEFSALAKLQRHIRKHTGEKPFRCLYCEMRFSRSDNLHTHMVRRHTEEAEQKCQECGDKYHNHSWSQWYQHLKYPGGVPKDMESKKRSRSPAQTLVQPQLSLLAAHQSSLPSLIGSGENEERRPRFRAKQRRDRDVQLSEVPSLNELGRLLPGVEGTQIHYPFISQNSLFRMGLTVDPSTLLIQHPTVTSRPLDMPQMVMVQPDVIISKSQVPTAVMDSTMLTTSASFASTKPTETSSDELNDVAGPKMEIVEPLEKSSAEPHGVHIRPDVAMLAANALVDVDQDMKDDEEEVHDVHKNYDEPANHVVEDIDETKQTKDQADSGPVKMDDQEDPEQKDTTDDLYIDERVNEEEDEEDIETKKTNVTENDHIVNDQEEMNGGTGDGLEAEDNCENCDDIAIECEFCPLVFDGINNLTDHMITHKNVDAGELNTAIQKVMLCHSTSGANMVDPPGAPAPDQDPATPPLKAGSGLSCGQCDQTFTTKSQLAKHAKQHQNRDFPFSCTLCDKTFKTSSRLQRHLKTHTGETPHVCSFCGKKFGRKDNLKVHLNTAHSGADATQCPKCSKRFETPYALRQHMRWHTDRKYECSVCGTSFTWKCYLVRHMKSRHPDMAEV